MYLQFFPEEFIQLQKELINHPKLQELLANHADRDGELQFAKCMAEIASYCNIALDDLYTEKDLIKIADLCIWRLRAMNAPVIFTGNKVVDSPIIGLDGKPIVRH